MIFLKHQNLRLLKTRISDEIRYTAGCIRPYRQAETQDRNQRLSAAFRTYIGTQGELAQLWFGPRII
jgi:hypothetical protein